MRYQLSMGGATQKDLAKERRMRPASVANVACRTECCGFAVAAPNGEERVRLEGLPEKFSAYPGLS